MTLAANFNPISQQVENLGEIVAGKKKRSRPPPWFRRANQFQRQVEAAGTSATTANLNPVENVVKKKKRNRRPRQQFVNAVQASDEGGAPEVAASIIYPIQTGHNVPRRKKSKFPVLFCRPGVAQLSYKEATSEVQLAVQMSAMTLNDNVVKDFEEMGLEYDILKGIYGYGLEKPAYIQERAIVPCINGKDAIVQAQSGMGKTAALVISILQRIDRNNHNCQALILAPTRELAEQIEKVVNHLSKFMTPKITSFSCIGGRPTRKCKDVLLSGVQIVIGTVGRTLNMLLGDGEVSFLWLGSLKTFALDEADQLLDGSFGRELSTILEYLPEESQVILMSATMPGNILKIAFRFMKNPVTFLVRDFQLTLEGIRQYHVKVEEGQKIETLIDLYRLIDKSRGMIFCNTKKSVIQVWKLLNQRGIQVACINGDLTQGERDDIMAKFRLGEEGYRVLLTSDLLGRGIDVQQLNLVVNYEIPDKKEMYIHRVGRAGRYGRKGVALTLVTPREEDMFNALEAFYETIINEMPPENQFMQLLNNSVSS